ncbi:peptidylprolyl isomerase [bacterium]|nr:peptidylprolyl isomerase [bacterium]
MSAKLSRFLILSALTVLLAAGACQEPPPHNGMQLAALRDFEAQKHNRNVVVIETEYGEIVLVLMSNAAKTTARTFSDNVTRGFYDGLSFHYVAADDMIQGGDINSRDDDQSDDGAGDPGFSVPLEQGGRNLRGFVGLAHPAGEPDKGNSQFYILLRSKPELDGRYTVFGQVVDGLDVVQKISELPADADGHPLKKVVMKRVYVTERFL